MKPSSTFILLLAAISAIHCQNTNMDQDDLLYQNADIYGGLLLPQVRYTTHFNSTNPSTCGGTSRDKVHFITSQNLDSKFSFYIQTPFPNSMCKFRITEDIDQSNETSYVNLAPLHRTDVNADGYFPCGREVGKQTEFFDIPDQVDCDACILEWIWKGPDFIVRQCADITVVGGEDLTCIGQCLNGGICRRGVCICPPGYSGTHCEYAPGAAGKAAKHILAIIFFILLAVILLLLLIMGLYWCARKRIREGEKEQIYHTNKKYVEFDFELPEQPHGVDRPAEHVKPDSASDY